jgi:hypothetical protein
MERTLLASSRFAMRVSLSSNTPFVTTTMMMKRTKFARSVRKRLKSVCLALNAKKTPKLLPVRSLTLRLLHPQRQALRAVKKHQSIIRRFKSASTRSHLQSVLSHLAVPPLFRLLSLRKDLSSTTVRFLWTSPAEINSTSQKVFHFSLPQSPRFPALTRPILTPFSKSKQ